jgi:hypothetical protein
MIEDEDDDERLALPWYGHQPCTISIPSDASTAMPAGATTLPPALASISTRISP